MRAELAGLNHHAVPFLSHAAANLCRYYYANIIVMSIRVFTVYFICASLLRPKIRLKFV